MRLSFPKAMKAFLRDIVTFQAYGPEYFKQLTSEQLVTKVHKGYPKREWQKIRDRNEALDCRIYARSASIAIGIDRWQRKSKWKSLMGYKKLSVILNIRFHSEPHACLQSRKPQGHGWSEAVLWDRAPCTQKMIWSKSSKPSPNYRWVSVLCLLPMAIISLNMRKWI
jgi:phage terminase large subunit GpA-like protein